MAMNNDEDLQGNTDLNCSLDNIDCLQELPDVRDGLNTKQRAILYCLSEAQKEFSGRMVPTITLYGRVLEYVDISKEEFQMLLSQMAGMTRDTHLD